MSVAYTGDLPFGIPWQTIRAIGVTGVIALGLVWFLASDIRASVKHTETQAVANGAAIEAESRQLQTLVNLTRVMCGLQAQGDSDALARCLAQ